MTYNTLDFLRSLFAKQELTNKNWQDISSNLKRHRLASFVGLRYSELVPNHLKIFFADEIRIQALYNELFLTECLRLEGLFRNHMATPIVRLKGSSLISEIYNTREERHLTDLDLLVSPSSKTEATALLYQEGYKIIPQIIWDANIFKTTFEKQHSTGNMIYIDLHTQLLWRQNLHVQIKTELFKDREGFEFYKLTAEFQLAHLIANWAYQDTFVQLNKLIDIFLYLQKYPELSSGPAFISLIDQLGLKSSWSWIQIALQFLVETPNPKKSMICTSFLENPRGHKIKYSLMKHLTKENIWQAIEYDFKWLKAYYIDAKLKV